METIHRQPVQPTKENIEAAFTKITEFAKSNGYVVEGEMKLPTNLLGIKKSPEFNSKSQAKVVQNYLTRLDRKVTMGQANRFLHMLFKHVYEQDKAPKIEFSERELKIRASRKAWKKAQAEADKLQAEYKANKGDFYKKK